MAILPLLIPLFSFSVEICALITGLWVMSLLWRLLPYTRRLPIPPIHVCLNTHLPQLPSIPTSISDLNNSHLTPTPTHDCLEMAWLFVLWMRLFNFRPQVEDKEPYNCCNKNELVPERKEVGMYARVSECLSHLFFTRMYTKHMSFKCMGVCRGCVFEWFGFLKRLLPGRELKWVREHFNCGTADTWNGWRSRIKACSKQISVDVMH